MKGKIKLGTLILMLLFLIGCDPFSKSKTEFYHTTKSISLSAENVNAITLDSTEKEVTRTFGKPVEVEEVTKPKSKYLIYNGIEFGVSEDKVFRYYINKKYQTAKGITVGDHEEKVIQAYGENYYERIEGGLHTIGYFDNENMINLEFAFRENRIVGVIMEKVGYSENN